MKKHDVADIRETMEQLSTQQLDKMLQEELRKDQVDEDLVRLILCVLEEREKDYPAEITPKIEDAWNKYQTQIMAPKRRSAHRGGLLKVASIVLIVSMLFFIAPQSASADSIFDRLARWTESIFMLFSRGQEPVEYVFETDNPGLQEVYDTLTELGVTEPVVPMWLPEGYELIYCDTTSLPAKTGIAAVFSEEDKEATFYVDAYIEEIPFKYEKDETAVEAYEIEEATYHIMRNYDRWVVVWTKNNLECMLTIECQEDTLYKIIDSIWVERR